MKAWIRAVSLTAYVLHVIVMLYFWSLVLPHIQATELMRFVFVFMIALTIVSGIITFANQRQDIRDEVDMYLKTKRFYQ